MSRVVNHPLREAINDLDSELDLLTKEENEDSNSNNNKNKDRLRRLTRVALSCHTALGILEGFGVDSNRRLTLWLRDTEENNSSYILLRDGSRLPLPVSDLPVVKL